MEDSREIGSTAEGLALVAGFLFCARAMLPMFCVRVLDADAQTGAAALLAINFLLCGLAWVEFVATARRKSLSLARLPAVRWVTVYLALSGCSLLWSESASRGVSAAYWCGTAADVATVALLLRAGAPGRVTASLMKGFVYGACCVAAVAWLMPVQYDLRLGDEDYFNANTIANLCAFGVFFCQYLLRRREGKWTAAAVLLAVTVVRSLSKTTIAAFVLAESFLLIQDRTLGRRAKVLWTALAALTVLVFWGLFEAYYDLYTTSGNQAETLTGRTAIWTWAWDGALERPWFGHGFDSLWKVAPVFGTFQARHAENEVLQQLYAYGAAGVAVMAGVYGSLALGIRRLAQERTRVLLLAVVLFVLVRGLAEAGPFDLLLPLWLVLLLGARVAFEAAEVRQPAASAPESSRPVQAPNLSRAPVSGFPLQS